MVLTPTAWAQKMRVALFNFDYSIASRDVTSIFGGNVNVGKGIADWLVADVYSVKSRQAV